MSIMSSSDILGINITRLFVLVLFVCFCFCFVFVFCFFAWFLFFFLFFYKAALFLSIWTCSCYFFFFSFNLLCLFCIALLVRLKSNYRYGLRAFSITFSNIFFMMWQSVLLVEETRVPGENHLTCHKLLIDFVT